MNNLINKLRRLTAGRVGFFSGAISVRPWWHHLGWISRYWLRRIGWPGVLAIGIFVMCMAFYVSAIRPLQALLNTAERSAAVLQEELALGSKSFSHTKLSTEDQLAEFYRKFPVEWDSPLWLKKIVVLAQSNGLGLNDGEYKVTRDKVSKLVRYQMSLHVRGTYPQIRKFLTDLPGALPVVALENVQFERQKVGDPDVEAKIKLVLYLEQAS